MARDRPAVLRRDLLLVVRDVRQLDAFTYTIGLAGIVLLLLPVVPGIGYEINGARLWVNLGFIQFQPAEFGTPADRDLPGLLPVAAARAARGRRRALRAAAAQGPRPLLLAWGASLAVLFLERDMGASLLLFGVFVVMLWVATARSSYLVLGLLLFAVGAYLGWLTSPHIQDRVAYWIHALDPARVQAIGYGQLAQGWFAFASGGMVGTGLGLGSPT